MKACRDCIHIEQIDPNTTAGLRNPKCLHPKSYIEIQNYHDGTTHTVAKPIDIMRTIGECGPDAKLFTAEEG